MPVALVSLEVEQRRDPLGVDVRHPRFGWTIRVDDPVARRGIAQSSYRLVVRRARDGAPIWDSGVVASPESVGVRYGGPRLSAATAYRWSVEVETTAGAAHAEAEFATGLTTDSDWGGARWVGRPRAAGSGVVPAPAPLLRQEFDVPEGVASARLYLAAGGYADVSLNGSPVSDALLSPGFTDYDDHVQYTVTDVTGLLRPGGNAIGAVLGRGFYGMTNGNVWRWESAPWHDEPVMRALLRIDHGDGSVTDVVSDERWTFADGATLVDDLYGGEVYDARRESPGFDLPGFDDDGWAPAFAAVGPRGRLINQVQPPIRVVERMPATTVTVADDGTVVVGFPRVVAGTVEVTVAGSAGTSVSMAYGEKLTPTGRVDRSNNGEFASGFQQDTFVLAGGGAPEVWAARFSYKGFQFVEVSGWPDGQVPSAGAFLALVLRTDVEVTGAFECSDPLLNRIHRAAVDTMLNNLHGIPTDTPMFEKNGWTGDAAVGAEMFLLNADVRTLLAKWVGDIDDTRDAEGAPLVIAPSSGDWGAWGVAPAWHSAFVLIPWWLYLYAGDLDVLERYAPSMIRYLDLEFDRSPGGIVPVNVLGDWVSPDASPEGGNAPEDPRVSGTVYLFAMLDTMATACERIGRAEDAARLRRRAASVRAAFQREFFDEEAGCFRGVGDAGYRQTHNVLALAFGMVPDPTRRARIAESIARDVRGRGTTLNTGALGSKYLLPVLTEHGHADLAWELATQRAYPSWGFMIDNGATTMWEHWALEARSRGHYFLGTVEDWLFHHVAGITGSSEVGYRELSISPRLTACTREAAASTATPFGRVAVRWRREESGLSLTVDVPIGPRARIRLPAAARARVTEGGEPLGTAPGVRDVQAVEGDLVVSVGSGRYHFTVHFDDRHA